MNKEDKAFVKAKKFQAYLGIFFLIPPILGVVAFVICLLGGDGGFERMSNLSYNWVSDYAMNGGGGMSAAPVYLGMMAMVGAYLIKDSLHYLFMEEENKKIASSEKPSVAKTLSEVKKNEE